MERFLSLKYALKTVSKALLFPVDGYLIKFYLLNLIFCWILGTSYTLKWNRMSPLVPKGEPICLTNHSGKIAIACENGDLMVGTIDDLVNSKDKSIFLERNQHSESNSGYQVIFLCFRFLILFFTIS